MHIGPSRDTPVTLTEDHGKSYSGRSDVSSSGSTSSKKRKRPVPRLQLECGPFTISDTVGTPQLSTTISLEPCAIIDRTALPLTFVRAATNPGVSSGARLFASSLRGLDQLKPELADSSKVVIAQTSADRSLYAVEYLSIALFSLCPLASWVTLSSINRLPRGQAQEKERPWLHGHHVETSVEEDWWQSAAIKHDDERVPLSNVLKEESNVTFKTSNVRDPSCLDTRPHELSDGTPPGGRDLHKEQDELLQASTQSLNAIRNNYQEALYASKTPLIYFAKGPLSRARSHFQSLHKASPGVSQLIEHLRCMLLPVAMLDKKYKDSIVHVIKDLPFFLGHDGDSATLLPSAKKPRKTKKTSLRKNGLYPNEEASISNWWLSKLVSQANPDSQITREEFSHRLLGDQKAREIQLQIVVLLEALALEAVLPPVNDTEDTIDHDPTSSATLEEKSKKPKKIHDLHTLLDIFIDRLSIWQTMTFELADTTKAPKQVSFKAKSDEEKNEDRSNQLQSFCVDVVVPFYAARLPEKTRLLCQKLGGPKDPSPKRPVVKKAGSRANDVPVDSSSRRPKLPQGRKTLERVLTDERPPSRRHTPSLSRSATESSLAPLKREISDTSLLSVPVYQASASQRYSQREVDLRGTSQVTEAKLKKKAEIADELQDAIAALKKPNARAAVREFVEAADKRVKHARSRKPLNPVRNPLAAQVMATPRRDRYQNIVSIAPIAAPTAGLHIATVESSASKVPCSLKKNSSNQLLLPPSSNSKPRTVLEVEQTPSKGATRFKDRPTTAKPGLYEIAEGSGGQRLDKKATGSVQLPGFPAALRESMRKFGVNGKVPVNDTTRSGNGIGALNETIQEATPMKGQKILQFSENGLRVVVPPKPPEPCFVNDEDDEVDLL